MPKFIQIVTAPDFIFLGGKALRLFALDENGVVLGWDSSTSEWVKFPMPSSTPLPAAPEVKPPAPALETNV